MTSFFNTIVLNGALADITIFELLVSIGIIFIGVVVTFFLGRRVTAMTLRTGFSGLRRWYLLLVTLLWFGIFIGILVIIGVNISDVLNAPLIKTKTVTISVNHLLISIVILVATKYMIMGIERLVMKEVDVRNLDRRKTIPAFKVISYLIWIIAMVFILKSVGIKMTLLLGAGAALLVGVGLGLQQIVADIVSGFILMFEGNLKVDDVVELENGIVGRVLEIGLRASKVQTRDDVVRIVPNSQFIVDDIINWSHIDTNTRFFVQVGVAYGSDVRLVEKILLECAKENKDIASNPKSFVRFLDFADSALVFQLFFWSDKTFRVENIKSDLRFLIDKRFRENGVRIPFPQRDVHLYQTRAGD